MERSKQAAIKAVLTRIRKEYFDLAAAIPDGLSIRELIDQEKFRLADYCRGYAPNPCGPEMYKVVEEFGRRHNIWLDHAKHYISITDYMYPSANLDRLICIGKTMAVDFYLNSLYGRERISRLAVEEKKNAEEITRRIATLGDDYQLSPNAFSVEHANLEILHDIRRASPAYWFAAFVYKWKEHIKTGHLDHNAIALDYIPSVEDYMERRSPISGMPQAILLIELGDNVYLPWPQLAATEIDQSLRRLHQLVDYFGALLNDLFSFEKEFIDHGSDSNLIVSLILNDVSFSLEQGIGRAATIVREILMEFVALFNKVQRQAANLTESNPRTAAAFESHLQSLKRCVQSCWEGQMFTMLYKRPSSIWRETRLELS
jgi:hypothetical protein